MRIILLTQTSSLADLQRQRPNIESLLNLPGVAGFSLRIPAKVANPTPRDWSGLDALATEAGDIAIACGNKEVQLRMMYGRWAPTHASRYWGHFPGGSLGGTDVNLAPFYYPLPFSPRGTPNRSLMRWVSKAQRKVVRASVALQERGLPVSVVHMSHMAGTWAEVFVVEDMTRYPGYDVTTIVSSAVQVMETAADVAEAWGGQAEFALSGHVSPTEIRGFVYGSLSDVARRRNPSIIINRNDIRSDVTNFDAMPTAYPLGWQSYGSGVAWSESQDWVRIFDKADEKNAVYYEAYPGNFSPAFRDEIARRYA